MKETGWYRGDQKPVRVGVYKRLYIYTTSADTDPIASHIAAKNARGGKDCQQRLKIVEAVESCPGGLNYKEIACVAGLEPIAVARRIAECGLRYQDRPLRDGCGVWFK